MSLSASVPVALTSAELADLTRRYADEVRCGMHEVYADADERWHVRLHSDEQVDVWLISWTTEQGTELHDHGGSGGAFTVVSGRLTESVHRSGRGAVRGMLVDLGREAGETIAFGDRYVHDVRNHDAETAVSVHAYSPPLSLMHYYDMVEGELVRRASAWTNDPEAPAPERVAS